MICTRCGAEFPDDQMVCPICGAEVQIVPDYNPLDDVLAQEVRGSVEGATRQIQTDDIRRYRRDDRTQNVNSTRVLSQDEMDRIRDRRRGGVRPADRTPAAGQRQNTAEQRRPRQDTGELRRQRQQKRLEAAKRKRRNLLITLFVILAVIVAGIIVVYQNSYTSMINKGYRSLQSGDYTAAEEYFQRAVI